MNTLIYTLEFCCMILGLTLIIIFRHRRYVNYERSSLPGMRVLLDFGIGSIVLALIFQILNLAL